MSATPGWWPVIASSGALSLALLGDSLIYAVLPVHAAAFGVSLAWVGVLLSVNRFVRVFAYGLIARLADAFGLRRMCIVACAGAAVSTALYGTGEGTAVLMFARVLWGLAYAVLVLVTLGYAVAHRPSAGTRVGWSRAIQRIGPVLALLAGGWLAARLGPRAVFLALAAATLVAVPLAWSLPRDPAASGEAPVRHPALGRPRPLDGLFFMQGFGVDGVFVVSITLLIAQQRSLDAALMSGAALLALRHVVDGVAGPVFGALGDRYGAAPILAASVLLTAAGFIGVALGLTVAGALVLLVFRGAIASLGPATVVQSAAASEPIIGALARMQAWRDLGAAIGPLVTGVALASVAATVLHALVAAMLLAALAWWRISRRLPVPRQ